MILLWVLALSCRRAGPPQSELEEAVELLPPLRSVAGVVTDGTFEDSELRYSLKVGEGWQARPGWVGDARRLELEHVETAARIEIWRVEVELFPLRPDCMWTFRDSGPYLTVVDSTPAGETATIGTCVPDDPHKARILAWVIRAEHDTTRTLRVELHAPTDAMLHAHKDALRLITELLWP